MLSRQTVFGFLFAVSAMGQTYFYNQSGADWTGTCAAVSIFIKLMKSLNKRKFPQRRRGIFGFGVSPKFETNSSIILLNFARSLSPNKR